jgi:hypothetical protein
MTQLGDLRSAIVKRACSVVVAWASLRGPHFDDTFVLLLPILCEKLYITIKVVRAAAANCMRRVVLRTHTPRVLAKLLEMCSTDVQ